MKTTALRTSHSGFGLRASGFGLRASGFGRNLRVSRFVKSPRHLLAKLILGCAALGLGATRAHAQLVLDSDSVQLLTSNFTGSLGPGAGQVRWEGSGGFAAQGADRTVRLNNSTAAIDWDAEYFVGEDNTLILGSPNANRTLLWDTGLNINVWEARIRVVNGTAAVTRAEAVIQQAIEGWGNLVVEGNGRLDITANNPNFTGEILISGAELRLNRAGRFGSVSNIKIEAGGTLTLDNRGTHTGPGGGQYVANRLNTAAGSQIELAGGTLQHIGQTNANTTTTLPEINLTEGSNTIDVINPTAGRFTEAQAKLVRATSSRSTVNFTSNGALVASGNGSRFKLTNVISDFISSLAGNGSIIPWATVNGSDWATVNGSGYITAYDNYTTTPWQSWNENSNVETNEVSQIGFGSLSINSLKINAGGIIVSGSGNPRPLNLKSGGLILRGGASINARNFIIQAANNAPVYLHAPDINTTATVMASFSNSSYLVKTGRGTVNLASSLTGGWFPGGMIVNEGSVIVANNAGYSNWGDITINASETLSKVMVSSSNNTIVNKTVKLNGGTKGEAIFQIGTTTGISLNLFKIEVTGRGVLDFGPGDSSLLLGQLAVSEGSELIVRSWIDQLGYFLVRKTSPNLADVLSRIHFEGYGPGAATRDYSDFAYWEIIPLSKAPEPTTYGAILGAVGVGLVMWRRMRKARNISLERMGA